MECIVLKKIMEKGERICIIRNEQCGFDARRSDEHGIRHNDQNGREENDIDYIFCCEQNMAEWTDRENRRV